MQSDYEIQSGGTFISRRGFICGFASAFGLLAASPVLAAVTPSPQRSLAFHHTHTGERAKITYWRDGDYLAEGLRAINRLLRDHRTGEQAEMDRGLIDTLYALSLRLCEPGEFQIISAYRSPKTNDMLRRKSKSGGVAKRSLHMLGRAIDIRVADCGLKQLRETAVSLKAGGVGYYPKSNFIHVDTGRVRYW
ncbi:MAG: DUF882 domain-containing protein [Chromatiales bacterium]|jgi:uncharacterized protein YcbK (DUF882 family)